MAQLWEVVGGGDKGGILVRTGKELSSLAERERLSTGALISEKALEGDRLHYALEEGSGPPVGWISIKLKDKDLAVRSDKGAALNPVAPAGQNGPERKLPRWKKVEPPTFGYMEMKERCAQTLPGDYYEIQFPHTKALIEEWGVKWLTKAFKKSGVMAEDNEVTELALREVTSEVSGGAGLKYQLKVKYKTEQPGLQTDLFVKLPHEPKGSDRYYVSVMWGHDRPEIVFNIWLSQFVPFKVPKMYFCDINGHTTNYILITEQVKFGDPKATEFKPGDIEQAYNKYKDWEMQDGGPMYYLASCRNLGKMAAYHKTGRLHPNTNNMFPMPDEIREIPKGFPGVDAETKKTNVGKMDTFIKFMSETATAAFPAELTDKSFLDELKLQMLNIQDFGAEIHCFCSGAGTPTPLDYVCLTHNNLQVDNAIYHHTDAGEMDVGMLDWGVLACGPLVNSIQGGCISGAQVHIYKEYRDKFIQATLDSYEEHGGPKLEFERMQTACDLQVAQWVCGLPMNTAAILKDVKVAEWATITDLQDERIQKKWNALAWCAQFNNALLIYQQMDIFSKFENWQREQGLPARK